VKHSLCKLTDLQFKTSASASATPASDHFESVVQKVFGGKLQTTYECLNCKSVSLHKECFTDLHLAVPEQKNTKNNSETTANYLTPATLQGENKYHCDHCGSLQDALKTMKIFEGPKYLTTTLMRFHYDRTQNRKSKVFTDIQYALDLNLPVHVNDEPMDQLYSLYAIVVHSGYSSDGGHYYTYAREPMTSAEADLETYNKTSSWYVFNDSNVSLSSFESFKSVFKRFPRDTAYVLFYQKISQNSENMENTAEKEEHKQENTKMPAASPIQTVIPKLNSEVKLNVENDNVKFMREKERNSSAATSKPSNSTMSSWPRGPADDGGPNGGSSRGCGGGGFNTPGRFVC
jgi:ubiquitin carboxyl-terminal hydrolase 35/38